MPVDKLLHHDDLADRMPALPAGDSFAIWWAGCAPTFESGQEAGGAAAGQLHQEGQRQQRRHQRQGPLQGQSVQSAHRWNRLCVGLKTDACGRMPVLHRKGNTAGGAAHNITPGSHTALSWRNALMAPQPDCSPLDPKPLGTGDRLLPSREGVRIAGAARCPAIGRHGGMAVGFAAASSLNLSCTLPTCELPGASVTLQHARADCTWHCSWSCTSAAN